jgi:acyl-CoA synthetase (AMP-forming)/AMP-acid ligase II
VKARSTADSSEPAEIAHQLNDSVSSVIFLDPSNVPKFEACRPLLKKQITPERVLLLCSPADKPEGTPYKSVFELLGGLPSKPETFTGDQVHDTVFLCYSSGTTGLPKGVMSTHYNMSSQLEAYNADGEKLISGKDKVLGVLPNSHIYGMVMINQRPLRNGVAVVFLPRYEEVAMLRAIATQRITQIFIVPPIMITMVQSKNTDKFDLSCMRTILSAAAPLGEDLSQAFVDKFPQTRITQGYGKLPIASTPDSRPHRDVADYHHVHQRGKRPQRQRRQAHPDVGGAPRPGGRSGCSPRRAWRALGPRPECHEGLSQQPDGDNQHHGARPVVQDRRRSHARQ